MNEMNESKFHPISFFLFHVRQDEVGRRVAANDLINSVKVRCIISLEKKLYKGNDQQDVSTLVRSDRPSPLDMFGGL